MLRLSLELCTVQAETDLKINTIGRGGGRGIHGVQTEDSVSAPAHTLSDQNVAETRELGSRWESWKEVGILERASTCIVGAACEHAAAEVDTVLRRVHHRSTTSSSSEVKSYAALVRVGGKEQQPVQRMRGPWLADFVREAI